MKEGRTKCKNEAVGKNLSNCNMKENLFKRILARLLLLRQILPHLQQYQEATAEDEGEFDEEEEGEQEYA
jgi:hypothetical protein